MSVRTRPVGRRREGVRGVRPTLARKVSRGVEGEGEPEEEGLRRRGEEEAEMEAVVEVVGEGEDPEAVEVVLFGG